MGVLSRFKKHFENFYIINNSTGEKTEIFQGLMSEGKLKIEGYMQNIGSGDTLVKVVDDGIEKFYTIDDVGYKDYKGLRSATSDQVTKIKLSPYSKSKQQKTERTIYTQYYAEGSQTINNNPDPEKIIEIINKVNMEHKDEVVGLIEDYKKTKNKGPLIQAVELLANGSQILGFIGLLLGDK